MSDRPAWTPERMLAVAGTAGLLLVGLASLLMIAGTGGEDREPQAAIATPTATATPTPTATPKPEPTPVPLTAEQRAQREAAAQIVTSRGFEPVKLRDYDPRRTLRVLLGRRTDGYRLAFFFVGDRYIGNDAREASAKLRVRKQQDTRVTLAYGTTGGSVDVRFQWDGSQLQPLDLIPSAEQRQAGPG